VLSYGAGLGLPELEEFLASGVLACICAGISKAAGCIHQFGIRRAVGLDEVHQDLPFLLPIQADAIQLVTQTSEKFDVRLHGTLLPHDPEAQEGDQGFRDFLIE